MIAAKFEEVYPPSIKDYTFVCDGGYNQDHLVQIEGLILAAVGFNLTTTTPFQMMDIYAEKANLDEKQYYLAKYFLEASVVEYILSGCKPGLVALSAVNLANKYFKKGKNLDSEIYSSDGINSKELRICTLLLWDKIFLLRKKGELRAIDRKFSHPRFKRVSRLDLEAVL